MSSKISTPITRRRFASIASVGGAATTVGPSNISAQESVAEFSEAYPFLTPAEEFYDVSRGKPKPYSLTGKALKAARLTPESWRLEISPDTSVDPPTVEFPATVEHPLTIEGETALDLHALQELGRTDGVKYIKAMQCLNISEPIGQGLWEGVPLSRVLRLCGKMENVRRIYYRGFHNNDPAQIFQSSVSYTQAMETAPGELPVFLAYRLNGEPISLERGGPVRMIVPWAHGFKSIKWLQQIFLTNDYRTNDTYALRNNDPESVIKTAAYVTGGPTKIKSGESVTIRGQIISGLSGVERVETFLQKIESDHEPLPEDASEFLEGEWLPAGIQPPPVWEAVLPQGTNSNEVLGFDPKTGTPLSWPLRYGMAAWNSTYENLTPGFYRIYARSVDRNGFAQPEPRSIKKSGKNMLQSHNFEVTPV